MASKVTLGKTIRTFHNKNNKTNDLDYYINSLDTYIKDNYKTQTIIDFSFEILPDNTKDEVWLFSPKDHYNKMTMIYDYCKQEDIKCVIHKPTKDPKTGLYDLNFTVYLLENYGF